MLFGSLPSTQKVSNFESFMLISSFPLNFAAKQIPEINIVMSSNSRVMRSKGVSDGLSLPVRTRQRKKFTSMENDENTSSKTIFDTGLDQHHPQMPVHTSPLPTQPPRPTSTQSITGPITRDRQPSRTILVTDNSGS